MAGKATVPSTMNARITSLLESLATALNVDINLANSTRFKAVLESTDGQSVNFRVYPLDQGGTAARKLGVLGDSLLAAVSGALTLDGVTGTATLVGSSVNVTVPAPADGGVAVPVGSTIFATVTTPGGVTKLLSATRVDNNTIQISSPGSGYGSLLSSAGVDGVLASGITPNIALANVAGDLLAVRYKTAGGTPGVKYSVERVDNNNVKVVSFVAGNTVQTLDTGTVTVFNFGQPAHETSVVRWAVIRP